MNSPASSASGYLNLWKPSGITSAEAVRRVNRATRAAKVGHGGTLDPLGAGVLPICIGAATRFAEFILLGTKEYRITVRLGAATDTYDTEGAVTAESDASAVTQPAVEAALPRFTGKIQQRPPAYSALKSGGKRLYDLARAGVTVETEPRDVEVLRLRLTRWAWPDFDLEVECSHGFYVRSLANDIGTALGVPSHLASLVRLRAGRFEADSATPLEALEAAAARGDWQALLLPVDYVLEHMPRIELGPELEARMRHGQVIPAASLPAAATVFTNEGQLIRAYDSGGVFIGTLRSHAVDASWRADRVIPVTQQTGTGG